MIYNTSLGISFKHLGSSTTANNTDIHQPQQYFLFRIDNIVKILYLEIILCLSNFNNYEMSLFRKK
jgi:hypothetical protein